MELETELSLCLQLLENLGILLGVGDDSHRLVVLGSRTDHAGAADVDVLDDVLE